MWLPDGGFLLGPKPSITACRMYPLRYTFSLFQVELLAIGQLSEEAKVNSKSVIR